MIRQTRIDFTYNGVKRHVTDAKPECYVFTYERDGVKHTDVYACFEAFIRGDEPIKSDYDASDKPKETD